MASIGNAAEITEIDQGSKIKYSTGAVLKSRTGTVVGMLLILCVDIFSSPSMLRFLRAPDLLHNETCGDGALQ